MKQIGFFSIALLLVAQSASAQSWAIFDVSVAPQDAAKVVAAADKLMSSKIGKEFPGRLLLQAYVANGSNPATHGFVPIYNTNQVEIWFSILSRRLLKRFSFTSLEDLRGRVLDFIKYLNDVLGKPFRWTYTGRPLQA